MACTGCQKIGHCLLQLPATQDAMSPKVNTVYDIINGEEDAPFLIAGDGRRALTHGAARRFLKEGVRLKKYKLGKASRVVFAVPNGPEAALGFFALSVRCTLAPLNIKLAASDIKFELSDLPADAVIVARGARRGGGGGGGSKAAAAAAAAAKLIDCAREAAIPVLELVPDEITAGIFTLEPLHLHRSDGIETGEPGNAESKAMPKEEAKEEAKEEGEADKTLQIQCALWGRVKSSAFGITVKPSDTVETATHKFLNNPSLATTLRISHHEKTSVLADSTSGKDTSQWCLLLNGARLAADKTLEECGIKDHHNAGGAWLGLVEAKTAPPAPAPVVLDAAEAAEAPAPAAAVKVADCKEKCGDQEDSWHGLDDVCLVLHTSGTTLKPKIVPLTQRNLCAAATSIASTLHLTGADVALNVMPLYHLHGIMVNLLVPAISGGAVVCSTGWSDAASFFDLAQRNNASWYSAVPTMHLAITQHAERSLMRIGEYPKHSLKFARNCSAALAESLAVRLECALGVVAIPSYAMSECVPICSNPRFGLRKLGSVGPPAGPSVKILVVTGDGDGSTEMLTTAPGVHGEVCVKGTCCTSGYEWRPHMTKGFAAFADGGYLKTGDKGYFDTDGYLFLSGRLKELINRAGEKISPLVIENEVGKDPRIGECLVFACPHAELGEAVGVAVVVAARTAGAEPSVVAAAEDAFTLASLRQLLAATAVLESKWLPECLVFVPSTPRGPTGKPLRIGFAESLQIPQLSHSSASKAGGAGLGLTLRATPREVTDADEEEHVDAGSAAGADDAKVATKKFAWELAAIVPLVDAFEVDLPTDVLNTYGTVSALAARIEALQEYLENPAQRFGLKCEYQVGWSEDATAASSVGAASIEAAAAAAGVEIVDADVVNNSGESTSKKKKKKGGGAGKGKGKGKGKGEKMAAADFEARKEARRLGFGQAKGKTRARENASTPGTGLHAAKEGLLEVLKSKVENEGWEPKLTVDRHGLTALQWAAGGGHTEVVQYLMDACSCAVDQPNKEGRTPLMWACRNGHLEVALLLAEHGAEINAVTKKGVSSLHWATWGGSIPVAKWLLERGLDIETLSNAGCNCAVWAAAAGRLPMCQWLWGKGANFDRVNFWGHGVVSKASWHGHNEVLEWLFQEVGCANQMFIINHVGEIPVELAAQAGHTATVELMYKYMAKSPSPFQSFGGDPTVHQHKVMKIEAAAAEEDGGGKPARFDAM
eukprot:gene4036-6101_t